MTQVTKQLRTETGHRLTNYDGRCSHLHGHSYLFEVTARAHKLDEKNMVIDFKDLKKAMTTVLDPLDHCMVLGKDDPLWEVGASNSDAAFSDGGDGRDLCDLFVATNGQAPRLIKWHENPTAESFAQWALEKIQGELCERYINEVETIRNHCFKMPYFISSVKVWETVTSYAEAKSGGL